MTLRDEMDGLRPLTVGRVIRLWFGLREPVARPAYILSGFLLMGVKFAIERALFSSVGAKLGVVEFLTPFFVHRLEMLRAHPDAAWELLAVTVPFLWIGLSMSARRAKDAGWPPLCGFAFLIPGVHYLLILALSLVPSKRPHTAVPAIGPYREPEPRSDPTPPEASSSAPQEWPPGKLLPDPSQSGSGSSQSGHDRGGGRGFAAVGWSTLVGLAMTAWCVYGLNTYGGALFLATPFAMGFVAAAAYAYGRTRESTSVGAAMGYAALPLVAVAAVLLMTAREGIGCILMAAIPGVVLAMLGALLGRALTTQSTAADVRRSMGALLALPVASAAGTFVERPAEIEVTTSVVVDAPPSVVWAHVIDFPDLDPPTEFMFRKGIAYPVRARIDGQGVGAVRRCEFSTGAFVEPITSWEPPTRLAFDVAENPPPMKEWNVFWDKVDAPHLHGFMRSKRGEFDLTALDGNRTRLEGTTVYELEIYPELYWRLWSDSIIHTIHHRVLDHIRRLSEQEKRLSDTRCSDPLTR